MSQYAEKAFFVTKNCGIDTLIDKLARTYDALFCKAQKMVVVLCFLNKAKKSNYIPLSF